MHQRKRKETWIKRIGILRLWPLLICLNSKAIALELYELEDIRVFKSQDDVFYTPGSAHIIDSEELKKFDYTDIGRVLEKTPGVYIQDEDGLGLRPNIGMRGAHPHRSRKITIMEDGILIGPSPYSAPAAYYFPSMSRISDVEVYKGPSSVQYGPNSIGGALNLVTRGLSGGHQSLFDIGIGRINKYEVSNSGTLGKGNYFVQLAKVHGETNKELLSGEKTYFDQQDVLIKTARHFGGENGAKKQKLQLKLSYANEASDETYLGVSSREFDDIAYKRYAATQDDRMEWRRSGIQLDYAIRLSDSWSIYNTMYYHQMERDWNKFNGINDSSKDLREILNNHSDASLIALLRGDRDGLSNSERLLIGNNSRDYYSQGVQSKHTIKLTTAKEFYHQIKIGLRLHQDEVKRDHTQQLADMKGGGLSYVPGSDEFTNRQQDFSSATTLFLEDEVSFRDFTFVLGNRVEHVATKSRPRNGSENLAKSDILWAPGLGINYGLGKSSVLLAGVNKGVTLVGPGQDDDIKPEETWNYEVGLRVNDPYYFELIGFFSDYKNIKGTCSFSTGCLDDGELGSEYNGGEAEIYGLESLMRHDFVYQKLNIPMQLSYSYTMAHFTDNTTSENKEWGIGEIEAGDPLPYIPTHQISLKLGLENARWSTFINYTYKDEMADQSVSENRAFIAAFSVIDFSLSYSYSPLGRVYFKLDNILDETYVTSLRPFGARPGKPRTVMLGLRQQF